MARRKMNLSTSCYASETTIFPAKLTRITARVQCTQRKIQQMQLWILRSVLEEEDSKRAAGSARARARWDSGGTRKERKDRDPSEDPYVKVKGTRREGTARGENRGHNERAASWLITKRNLSEHHGNALSNIVSPRERQREEERELKRTLGTDSQINAL